jgi:hypothetical protein
MDRWPPCLADGTHADRKGFVNHAKQQQRNTSRSPQHGKSDNRSGRSGRDHNKDIKPKYGMTPKKCKVRSCNGAMHATSQDCLMFGKCFTCNEKGHAAAVSLGTDHGHGLLQQQLPPWAAADAVANQAGSDGPSLNK